MPFGRVLAVRPPWGEAPPDVRGRSFDPRNTYDRESEWRSEIIRPLPEPDRRLATLRKERHLAG